MPWTKLADEFPQHPKILAAGPMAELLHIHALIYCNTHLTDGFVPTAALPLLKARAPYVTKLVSVGLWEKVVGGYMIHDFLDYQPSREEVLAARSARKVGKIAGGLARAANAPRIGGRFVGKSTSSEAAETSSGPAGPPAATPAAGQQRIPIFHQQRPAADQPRPVPARPVATQSTLENNALPTGVPIQRDNGELSVYALAMETCCEEVLQRRLTPQERSMCQPTLHNWLSQFRYLSPDAAIARLKEHNDWCHDHNTLPRKFQYLLDRYFDSLRKESDDASDNGAMKADYQPAGRTGGTRDMQRAFG